MLHMQCMWTHRQGMITLIFKCLITCCITIMMLSTWCGTWSHKPSLVNYMLHFNSMVFSSCCIIHVLVLDMCSYDDWLGKVRSTRRHLMWKWHFLVDHLAILKAKIYCFKPIFTNGSLVVGLLDPSLFDNFFCCGYNHEFFSHGALHSSLNYNNITKLWWWLTSNAIVN